MSSSAAKAADARLYSEGDQLEVVSRQPGVGGQLIELRTVAARYEDLFLPMFGEHQAHNALLAVAATEALLGSGGDPVSLAGPTLEAAFAGVTNPGRLEAVRTAPMIIVDAAHNPAGVDALAEAMRENFTFETLVGVVGVLGDKDAAGILDALEPLLDQIVVTASASPRAISVTDLAKLATEAFGEDRVHTSDDLPDAIDKAVQLSEAVNDLGAGVLVTGSISLVADARILLGADKRKGAGRAR